MAKRKTTATRRQTTKSPKTRRKTNVRTRKNASSVTNFFVPLFFIICIVFCLGFLFFMGYRTVTASAFFSVKAIEVGGVNRASKDDIEKVVRLETERNGVWNADLNEIKQTVEQLSFVKNASISRILPDGIKVNITERVPRAVVRIEGGDFWADEDAVVFSAVEKNEARPPFVLQGWDREKSEKAIKDNRERVRVYLKMLDEWREFELARRVTAVDLSDLKEPQAMVEDSGATVKIALGRENFVKRLQSGLKAIAGKGNEYEAVSLNGQNLILSPRKNL